MKYTVYVIQGKDGELYKGITSNLEQRLISHNSGFSRWTKNRSPFRVVYIENNYSKTEALKRERFLKSGKGREFLKNICRRIAQPGSARRSGRRGPGFKSRFSDHSILL